MKNRITSATVTAAVLLLLSFVPLSRNGAEDVFEQVGTTRKKALELMLSSIGLGSYVTTTDITKAARRLTEDVQVTVVKQLIAEAKSYCQSEQYASDYKNWRDERLGYKQKGLGAIRNPVGLLQKKAEKEINKGEDEKKLPSDPKVMLKNRLQEFLHLSATVDFSARTSTRGGTIYFVTSEQENKSREWKACFRAGEKVINAAREEVEKWLQEL